MDIHLLTHYLPGLEYDMPLSNVILMMNNYNMLKHINLMKNYRI